MNTVTHTSAAQPVPRPRQPEQSIEQVGSMIKITEKIGEGADVIGIDALVNDGSILTYSVEGDKLTVFAHSSEAAEKLKQLQIETHTLGKTGIIAKMKELLIPPNIEENCADEYLQYRMWQLGGAVCGGALGFVNNIVSEGAKGLIQDKSKIAKSAEVNTNIGRILSMAGSYIARKGDADPKRFTFISSAIASGTTLVAIATLAAFPGAFFPVVLGTAVSGVISGTLGGAAGVNIANHMAKGPNKGEVAAKNSNQDLLAALMGAPLAMSLSKIATVMGTNPILLTLGTMGVGLAVCTVMGASAIKMEPVTQEKLENIVDQYIKTGEIPEAEQKSWRQNIKSLFCTPSENVSKRITFVRSLDEVVGNGKDAAGADGLFPMFNDDHYLLSYHGSDDKINILFKKKAAFNDVAKAFTQARLMEMALDGGMFPALQQVCGDRAGKALADLTHRTVPSEMKIDDGMKEKGWHPSAGNLSFERLEIPNGPATETATPITLEQFMKLVADPSPEELRKFVMKDDIQDGGHTPAGIEKKTAK